MLDVSFFYTYVSDNTVQNTRTILFLYFFYLDYHLVRIQTFFQGHAALVSIFWHNIISVAIKFIFNDPMTPKR